MTWEITAHLCRACLGRVFRRRESDGAHFECSQCRLTAKGRPQAICCCGARLQDGRLAGMRCTPNKEFDPQHPGAVQTPELVVEYVGIEAAQAPKEGVETVSQFCKRYKVDIKTFKDLVQEHGGLQLYRRMGETVVVRAEVDKWFKKFGQS